MTIDEAIEVLEIKRAVTNPDEGTDLIAALGLGIEALKRINHLRKYDVGRLFDLLEGETK